MTNDEIWAQVRSQAVQTPAIYGAIDFDRIPERFAGLPDDRSDLPSNGDGLRDRILADPNLIDRMRAYTHMGDRVADPYAALMPQHGFRKLVDMLVAACDHGIDAVPEAPPELRAFMAAMEHTPAWLDMDLVEEGAKAERASSAIMNPFAIRSAFIATFMNKYAALPMVFTGTLTDTAAARRVKETATFFATSVLPGALARNGAGFKAAAMVRLMHSMVRFNVMRKGRWDVSVYGVPIPQVDQMPAGLIGVTMMATDILRSGRKDFTPRERARVELSRYRCYLLGLPETLLGTTPEEIVTLMVARQATLRAGFDDATCGVLLRATLNAYLPVDTRWYHRAFDQLERGFSKVLFVRMFLNNDERKAERIGVTLTAFDRVAYLAGALATGVRLALYGIAERIPVLARMADRRLVAIIEKQLASYGHAHFTTDSAAYRPTIPAH